MIASEVDLTRRTHGNRRQRKEGNAPSILSLQVGYGGLRRIRILRDDVPHTPAECHVDCRKISLWNADEVGDGSGNPAAPSLRYLQDGLYVTPEPLIAVLHTSLKVKALTDAKKLCIRLPQLRFLTLDCTAQLLSLRMQALTFLRQAPHILFRKRNCLPLVCEFTFRRRKEGTAALHFNFLLCLSRIPLLRSGPSHGKLLSQPRQYTLYGSA